MPQLDTPAIVLSTIRYSETSKIVRLATRECGVQSAIAKGALRPRSRFGAALQSLSEGQARLLMKEHRELHVLASFDLLRLHVGLASHLERYATASVLAEVMLRFAPADPHPESYDLLRDALSLLEVGPSAELEALGFRALWQLVSALGFAPELDACVRDGTLLPAEGGLAFSTREGGALCPACAAGQGATQLPADARADLGLLLDAGAPLPLLDRRHAESHRRLLARYIRYHLGEGAELPALDFSAPAILDGGVIIGMAGHIDHGKSALVTALTGRAMDRLAEERRRGITIDLNFAPLDLGNGAVAGVVDVPGHEHFVRTMVAGASGVDLALLVVAADEGVMPQTLEHLSVLEHLGVPLGIPVLTKCDLVDRDWLDLVTLELSERLAISPMEFRPPVCVSAKTGQGLDDLRRRIAECAPAVTPRASGDLFRLPVDRAFSVAGVGTVVTGTAWSGRIRLGDEVVLLPLGPRGRVRSIEIHGRAVERSEPGRRTAVGIAGISRDGVTRGSMLVAAGDAWEPTAALDVELSLDAGAPRSLVHRSRLRVHLGTAETIARVLPRPAIEPGGRGLARLALESPVVARGGDRFVIRSFSPVATIGGGVVLDPMPPVRRARWPAGLAAAEAGDRLTALVERRTGGVPVPTLPVLLGIPPDRAHTVAAGVPGLRLVGELWVTGALLTDLGSRSLDLLRRYHRGNPIERGMPLETLRHSLHAPAPVVEAVLADLVRTGRMRRLEGLVALAGFVPRAAGGDAAVDEIVRLLENAGLTPPSVQELERDTGRHDVAAILRLAANAGRVEPVERDRYFARLPLDRFVQALREGGADDEIVPSQLRQRLGISRKYLIPLLEWADVKGVTSWDGGVRRLRVPGPA